MQLFLLKFLFSALICFLFGILLARRYCGVPEFLPLAVRQWNIFRAFALYALILGLCGMCVPCFWWPWGHLLIYPLATGIIAFLIAVSLHRIRVRR